MNMNVIKSLNQRGQHNWIKILCLAVGLATGIVLIGKAGFEQSWDKDFDTSDRIYVLYEDIIRDGEYQHYLRCRIPLNPWILAATCASPFVMVLLSVGVLIKND